MSHGFSDVVGDVLRMDPMDRNYCYGPCHVPSLISAWIICALIIFFIHESRTGSLKTWFRASGRAYQLVKTQGDGKPISAMQRTFNYPDTLEFNFFDPDNLPDILKPQADATFMIVQKLASSFGFQVDNSRNQAEHLLMMITNETKPSELYLTAPALRLHTKMFSNYRKWCDRVGAPPEFCIIRQGKSHTAAIEDMLMFLLIWGESANIRHLPECLCWLYHKTMKEHLSYGSRARENLYPGFYLDMVITPIYEAIAVSLKAKGDHVGKKIYDDFNEFFWSPTCLQYIHRENYVEASEPPNYRSSYVVPTSSPAPPSPQSEVPQIVISKALMSAMKTYLERRSWLHPLYSFHRVFEWHVVTFYILATIAFGYQLVWTTNFALQVGSFVFWMINFMSIVWTCLEVWTVFPSASISGPSLCGYLLRLLAGFMVLVYQTIYFHWSFRTDVAEPDSLRAHGDANFWWWQFVWLSLVAESIYILESVFCWFPSIVSGLMCWNNDMVQALLNILYPLSQLYVGKRVHVSQGEVSYYILFWLTLLAFKFWFGFYYVILPVTVPTLELYDDYMNFLDVPFIKTAFLMGVWWFPHFLVYLIDLSIWYTVWGAGVGGFIALVDRQGAVRDAETLRTHFMRMPYAFCQKLMPSTSILGNPELVVRKASSVSITGLPDLPTTKKEAPKQQKSGHKRPKSAADLANYGIDDESNTDSGVKRATVAELLNIRTQRWVAFARAWNTIIGKLRDTDHLSDAEKSILIFTNFDWLTKPVYLPLFQTAGCFETVLYNFKNAAESYHREQDPLKRMMVYERFKVSMDVTSAEAVNEAWELANWLLQRLVGSVHAQDLHQLHTLIWKWASSDDIFVRMSLDGLPSISDHISNIVGALKNGLSKRKKTPVVTPEVLQNASKGGDDNAKQSGSKSSDSGAKMNMKKSVSTSFLAGLGDSNDTVNEKSSSVGESKPSSHGASTSSKFAKLQPFRKSVVLTDSVRDKVREELRGLLNAVRTALRAKGGALSGEAQDLVDRITFVLSMESGFLWNDIYASSQLDEMAKDPRVPGVVNKVRYTDFFNLICFSLFSHYSYMDYKTFVRRK